MKLPRIRPAKLMDVIRIDGRLHAVVRIDSKHGATIEPLVDTLGRHLLVGDSSDPRSLYEAMLERGWTPPQD